MKRVFALILFALIGIFAFADEAIHYPRPVAFGIGEQVWWRQRLKQEEFKWVDHLGHTNTAIRPFQDPELPNPDVKVSSGNGISGTVRSDFTFVNYTITYGHLVETNNYAYDVNKIAPGTYDLINGKWYSEMTLAEKHAMWAAYTNKVIQAIIADIEERKAPAKFDVQKSPEEYMDFLLAGRDKETLTPEEEREIQIEYGIYLLEWTRVNDPENYKPSLFPKEEILSEQQKKNRAERWNRLRLKRKSK